MVIQGIEGDRALELYKGEPGRGETENQRAHREDCHPNREGMPIDVESTKQPEIQHAESTSKKKECLVAGGVHMLPVPLADCTNHHWPNCEVMKQKQQQGRKEQWERRARKKVADSTADPNSGHERGGGSG